MFAVVGVTGKVGRAVARSLLDADQSVRAVVRDAAKGSAGSAWASRGCEVATADLDNAAPLARKIHQRENFAATVAGRPRFT
jgi:NAD(P)H dehydrogenase (quinone)